jgi:hypothetical protein
MQSTISRELGDRVRGVRVHHAAMIGGLALAVVAAIGLGGLENQRQPATSAAPPVSGPATVGGTTASRFLVYLVDSEAEKRALEQGVANSPEWFVETYAGDTAVRIVALEVGQEESLDTLAQLLPEASLGAGLGSTIKLVDMR